MGSSQTPNEIFLDYPKLKGGKGLYARPVIPERTSSRVKSAHKQRASSFREKTPASKILNSSLYSEQLGELDFHGKKSRDQVRDGGDYAVMYRSSVVARMR